MLSFNISVGKSNSGPMWKSENSTKSPRTVKTLQDRIKKAKTPIVEVESVYKVLPKAQKYVPKTEIPVPRFIWKEKDWPDGFPASPEEANVDLLTYLEQKDCYRWIKKMQFKEFSVGSYVAVTYADQYAIGGSNRLAKLFSRMLTVYATFLWQIYNWVNIGTCQTVV